MAAKQLIGLDVGLKCTGIARASLVARIAEPLQTVKTGDAVDTVKELVKQHSIDTIVIGLPRNLDGDETNQTRWVRSWAEALKQKVPAEFYLQDEALTSVVAEAEKSSYKKASSSDAFAAAVILQDFLDGPESERITL